MSDETFTYPREAIDKRNAEFADLEARAEAAERDLKAMTELASDNDTDAGNAQKECEALAASNLQLAEQVGAMRTALEKGQCSWVCHESGDGHTHDPKCLKCKALSLPVTHSEDKVRAMQSVVECAKAVDEGTSGERTFTLQQIREVWDRASKSRGAVETWDKSLAAKYFRQELVFDES